MTPGVYIGERFIDPTPSNKSVRALSQPVVTTTTAAPSVVQNGLLFYLDAGNPSSYPGTGTTWTDLSGNGYNATLVEPRGGGAGLPTFDSNNGGSIVFAGNYASVTPFPPTFPTGAAVRTLSAWCNLTSTGIWLFAPIFGFGRDAYGGASTLLGVSGLSGGPGLDGTNGVGLFTVNWPQAGNWFNLTVVTAANVHSSLIYVNGVPIPPGDSSLRTRGANAAINTTNDQFSNVTIGAIPGAEFYVYNLIGKVSVAMLYNRALTEAEILQNFNVHKDRYGY